MKDSGSGGGIGGDMTSAVGDRPPLLPSSSHHHHHHHNNNNHHHHDHRENRRAAGGGEVGEGVGVGAWRTMPSRGADINLLANSLTSRLRKSSPSSRHKAGATTSSSSGIPPSTTTTTTTTTITSSGSRSAPPEDSVRKSKTTTTTTTSKSTTAKRDSSGPHVPQSILKRTVSRETAEQQQQQRPGSRSPPEDLHLPDVFLTRRWSSSAGHLPGYHHNAGNGAAGDVVGEGVEEEAFNNQFLDRPSPALAILRGRRGEGGGGGGGGGGFFSTAQARNGQVTWVKRAGIFQPADKYAPGRQTLHGEDQPYGFSQPVDYETLTLSSRTGSPDSDVTSGWSSSHGASRRKGLKVSWKPHSDSETEGEREGEGEGGNTTPRSWRQRSAGTAQSEAYSFVKPKFHPGKSRVPVVGVKWKVPTPVVGRPPPADGVTEDGGRAPPFSSSTATTSSHSAPASGDFSSSSASSSSLSAAQRFPSSGKPAPNNTRDVRHHHHHPWRALHVRDVHPMTTAMEREGTSVSKTKWRVPSVRPVPAYTFIEDLMEAAGHHHHWHPVTGPARLPTRTTLDAHSVQQRVKDGASLASKDTAGTATTVSNLTDQGPPESSCQS